MMNIAIVAYCSFVGSAISSLINGFVGDYWYFDHLLIIASMLDVLTFWIEATTDKFYILAIAYVLGGQPMNALIFGYSTKMLPKYHSKRFQASWKQLYTFGYLGMC